VRCCSFTQPLTMSKIHVLCRPTRSFLPQHCAGYRCAPRLDVPSFHATSTSVLDWTQALSVDLLVFVIQVNRNAISTCVANLAPADLPAEDNKFCTAGICTAHSRNGEPLICLDVWEVPHGLFGQRYMVALSWKLVICHKNLQWVDFLSTLCAYMDGKSRGCRAASINFLGECVMC
jgi:hypothetical protein